MADLEEDGARMSFGAFVLKEFCKGWVVDQVFGFCGQKGHLGVFCLYYKKSERMGMEGLVKLCAILRHRLDSLILPIEYS